MTPKIQIPKAEIHCHLEGSIPPALARELAERNGLSLPAKLFDAKGHYAWKDFLSFLDSYDRVCTVLKTPRDFGDVIYSYLASAAREGAVYVESDHNTRIQWTRDGRVPETVDFTVFPL